MNINIKVYKFILVTKNLFGRLFGKKLSGLYNLQCSGSCYIRLLFCLFLLTVKDQRLLLARRK